MTVQAYASILRMRLIAGLQYRAAAWANLSIALVWGLVETTIVLFFYRYGHPHGLSMTSAQAVTYMWLAQCFVHLVPMSVDSLDGDLPAKVISGDLAYELCRPLDLYTHWYMRGVASRLARAILASTAGLAICAVLPRPYGILPPASPAALAGAVLSLTAALVLSCAWGNLLNVLLLKVELGVGLVNSIVSLPIVLSGLLVPLAVFPDWAQPALHALPFAGLIDYPCSLYTGLVPPVAMVGLVARQLAWSAALIALGRLALARGLRRIVVQGG